MFTKFQRLVLFITVFIIPIGCQDISSQETVVKNGLLHKMGDKKPFTGTISGYAREGYRPCKMKFIKKYKNGIRQGDTKFWYPNGKLESIEPYADGKVNGIITRYHENGRIKARIHIVNNQRGGSEGEQFWDGSKKKFKLFSKR